MAGAITNLTSWDDMRSYILKKLGAPVNNIEMSEDQLDLAIEDTVREYWKYSTTVGTYMDYIVFQANAGQSEYQVSAIVDVKTSAVINDIEAVYDFALREALDGINTLFSPQNILLQESWVANGGYPGGPGSDAGQGGMTLANFYSSMMYIESIREAFGKGYRATWIPGKQILKVSPTPQEPLVGVLVVYRRELATNLFNDVLVRKLALAKAKIQWGRNIGKYSGTLPDGLVINYQLIIDEGKEEEEKYLDWIRADNPGPDFFVA